MVFQTADFMRNQPNETTACLECAVCRVAAFTVLPG